jgi:putative ABC transport system permease protein
VPTYRLALRNLLGKKARSIGLAVAIGFAVMTVVTLTVVGSSLQSSATAVIHIGEANFVVAQKGVADILNSTIDEHTLERLERTPGVASAVGVLVETQKLNAANPVFIEVGIDPQDLGPFGVRLLAGHPYSADATNQVLLGWRAAQNFGLHVGDHFVADGADNTVVGIVATGNSFGDDAAFFPLPAEQGYNRVPGIVTLVFVKTAPKVPVATVEHRITQDQPELETIRTAQQFGRADLTLVFVRAAATGSAILAVVIGAIIIGNTMLLSLFERTREFGMLMAVGWVRSRIVALILEEGLALAVIGTAVGLALAVGVTSLLTTLPQLRGVLHPDFTASAFVTGLATAFAMTLLGTLYPALRAALRSPLQALSHE